MFLIKITLQILQQKAQNNEILGIAVYHNYIRSHRDFAFKIKRWFYKADLRHYLFGYILRAVLLSFYSF